MVGDNKLHVNGFNLSFKQFGDNDDEDMGFMPLCFNITKREIESSVDPADVNINLLKLATKSYVKNDVKIDENLYISDYVDSYNKYYKGKMFEKTMKDTIFR